MRRWIVCLALLLLFSMLYGCGADADAPTEADPLAAASQDFETQLRKDAFPEDDAFLMMLGDAVGFSEFAANDGTVTFTVRAPFIYEELVLWYETQESPSENQLQEKIIELLQSAPQETVITMDYALAEDGSIVFCYTEEYLCAAGCGLREFYGYLYDRMIEEMGVSGNE